MSGTDHTPICDAMRAAGQWNPDWDAMAALDPAWTEQFMRMVSMPLNSGVLDARTFELVAIAVDASVTHMFGPGVQRHIRRALDIGVPVEEIVAVLQLTASLGLHTMSLASPLLAQELERRRTAPRTETTKETS
jgi:alkylhydroperoxidase/carboxymuconolactone decarboxylase family protein YurZ